MTRFLPLLAAALVAAGCVAPCPEESMLDSEGGLVVTRAEHPDAWGEIDCAQCHALDALHLQGCAAVDLEAVRDLVRADGYEGCVDCHGSLGGTQ